MSTIAPHCEPAPTIDPPASANTSAQTARSSNARSSFAACRSTRALSAFRALLGLALCAHFAQLWLTAQPLVDAGLSSAARPGWLERATAAGLPSGSLYGIAIVLSVAIAVGLAPRILAALVLPFSIALQHMLADTPRLDDWLANVTLCWVMLLPSGAGRVPGRAVSLIAVHALALHVWVTGLRALSPGWQEVPLATLALCWLPAAYLLPLGPLRILGPLIQVPLHALLGALSGEWLAHAVLAASAIVLYGDRPTPAERSGRGPAIDLPFVLGVAFSALTVLAVAGAAFQDSAAIAIARGRARAMLDTVGLMPRASGLRPAARELLLIDERGVTHELRAALDLQHADQLRLRLLESALGARSQHGSRAAPALIEQSDRALRAIAERYCALPRSQRTVRVAYPGGGDKGLTPLASFDCARPVASARFISGDGTR